MKYTYLIPTSRFIKGNLEGTLVCDLKVAGEFKIAGESEIADESYTSADIVNARGPAPGE